MSSIKSVNKTFSGAYKKLGYFAIAPYNWSICGEPPQPEKLADTGICILASCGAVMINCSAKFLASPVLLPTTAITASIAIVGTLITALVHLVALLGAAIKDAVSSSKSKDNLLGDEFDKLTDSSANATPQ